MTLKIIVLYNLGTPTSLKLKDIRKYLFEFLMDPCVIDMAFIPRLLLVGGIIVPFRAPKTKKCYETIWTEQGSPLLTITQSQAKKLAVISGQTVLVAMRYGQPNLDTLLEEITKHIERRDATTQLDLTFISLYPHAALSTTVTAEREIAKLTNSKLANRKLAKRKKPLLKNLTLTTKVIRPTYNDPDYIALLVKSIKPYLKVIQSSHLLFSYHGVPERHVKKTDPSPIDAPHCLTVKDCCHSDSPAHQHCYRHQTLRTTELVTQALNLPQENFSHAYQSRLGRDPWLQPYTDQTIANLGKQKLKHLYVICPAFTTDNLETLFEIQIENQELFQEAGGGTITLIPCLNDQDDFIQYLNQLVHSTVHN